MSDLKQENKNLYRKIEDLRNEQKDLLTQVTKLQDELATQYKLYRDERDARKLLQSDINDLRYQQEDYQMSQKQENEEEDDPVMLKIALKWVLQTLSLFYCTMEYIYKAIILWLRDSVFFCHFKISVFCKGKLCIIYWV